MDPEACLARAALRIRQGDYDDAYDALGDYSTWRRNGGYEPMTAYGIKGDAYCSQLRRAIARADGEL